MIITNGAKKNEKNLAIKYEEHQSIVCNVCLSMLVDIPTLRSPYTINLIHT